jgi:hypothetical protein
VIQQLGLVAVLLDEVDYDEADDSAASRAHVAVRRRISKRQHFRLDDFRWTGHLPKVLKRGVRVLMCTQRERGGVSVTPPSRVLELRRYRSARGATRVMVVSKSENTSKKDDCVLC